MKITVIERDGNMTAETIVEGERIEVLEVWLNLLKIRGTIDNATFTNRITAILNRDKLTK